MKMPYVHNISTRIGGRRASASFWRERGSLPIPRIHQYDSHSCGFLAALVVAQYFDPSASAMDVLKAMPKGYLPSPTRGLSEYGMRRTLARFGIECPNRERLGWAGLLKRTTEGRPVIVTVLPEDWDYDHWTVIRKVTDYRVWLSNYDEVNECLSWDRFSDMWRPYGEGMVCRRV